MILMFAIKYTAIYIFTYIKSKNGILFLDVYGSDKKHDLEKSTKFLEGAVCPRYLLIVSKPDKYNLSPDVS